MALTFQLQSLLYKMPVLLVMRWVKEKSTFLSLPPPWQLIFLGITHLSLICWPMSYTCVNMILLYLYCFWMLHRQKLLVLLRCLVLVLASFSKAALPGLNRTAQGLYVVSLLVPQWLTCSLSPQDVGLLEIPAELAALLQLAEGKKSSLLPSLSCTLLLYCLFPCFLAV